MTLKGESVLLTKLDRLRQSVERIESQGSFDFKQLATPGDLQDIIVFNIQKAVQICVDIAAYIIKDQDGLAPQTMAQTFDSLLELGAIDKSLCTDMKKSVGLRNVIVHEYDDIDWVVVNDVVKRHLPIFKKFAEAILSFSQK